MSRNEEPPSWQPQVLMGRVIASINAAPDSFAAHQAVIKEVCAGTGWLCGESWTLDSTGQALTSTNAYHCAHPGLTEWYEKGRAQTFVRGQGLPGHAWQSMAPVWWRDVSATPAFVRRELALRHGIRAGFAIPITAAGQFLGCFAFYLGEPRDQDPALVDLISAMAAHLGEVLYRRSVEVELAATRERARQTDEIKEYFLQNLSHELRTPMNGILGLSAILRQTIADQENREMVELIERSAQRLLRILDQLIHLSLLRADRKRGAESDESDLAIDQLVRVVASAAAVQAERKRLEFRQQLAAPRALVRGAEAMLTHAIEYLLDNAIKFTAAGSVSVATSCVEDQDRQWVRIAIKDTGIGIPPHKQRIIFEDFRQASEGAGRAFDGVGLSLSLAKRIVEGMRGRIDLESSEKGGTTVTVYLPMLADPAPPVQSSEGATTETQLLQPRILSVEDNEINQMVLARMLRGLYTVVPAADGEAALRLAEATLFDAVLVDINLGAGLDGVEVQKRMRELPGYREVPFVAVTGQAMPGDQDRLLTAGFDAYIAKPYQSTELRATVDSVVHSTGGRG